MPQSSLFVYRFRNFFRYAFANGLSGFLKAAPKRHDACFVVGCGHSGTTLIAARLGLHKEVFLVGRESAIFTNPSRLMSSRKILAEWFDFASYLGRRLVLEKTPRHVYVMHAIRNVVPSAKFIGITRNPLDTVASLYKRYGDLDASINRWVLDNEALLKGVREQDTLLVRFEELTTAPETVLAQACAFIGIEFSEDMLEEKESSYSQQSTRKLMILRSQQVSSRIKPNQGKWREVLSSEQAAKVVAATRSLALKLGHPEALLALD